MGGAPIRAGALAGRCSPPHRCGAPRAVPLIAPLQAGDAHRPQAESPEARARLLPHFHEDIALLAGLAGEDFSLWLSRGEPRLVRGSALTLD